MDSVQIDHISSFIFSAIPHSMKRLYVQYFRAKHRKKFRPVISLFFFIQLPGRVQTWDLACWQWRINSRPSRIGFWKKLFLPDLFAVKVEKHELFLIGMEIWKNDTWRPAQLSYWHVIMIRIIPWMSEHPEVEFAWDAILPCFPYKRGTAFWHFLASPEAGNDPNG